MARSRRGLPIHGWLVVDKPAGMSSAHVVAKVRRLTGAAKAGHGGTLDPLATGVLPIALGEATKTVSYVMDGAKGYRFTLRFGEARSTDDAEGPVTATSPVRPSAAEIRAVLPRFVGLIEQVPPAFSALKVDGVRAYELARADETVELAPRLVRIDSLELVGQPDPDHAQFSVRSGKGAYMRSLARDIAEALGTVGHVTMLRRLRAGPFGLAQAISLDKLNEIGKGAPLENVILPLEAGLVDIPALDLGSEQASMVRQGRVLSGLAFDDGLYWARNGDRPLALVELSGGDARVVRGFNLPDVAE